MENIFLTYKPEGFHSLTPYLMVSHPALLIEFLKSAFFAQEINCSFDPKSGEVTNCILQIGDACFMISRESEHYKGMKTSFYLFVDNVDEMHQRAIAHGAKVEFEPADMPYQDRQSGIMDPCGNYWWISKRMVQKGYHE